MITLIPRNKIVESKKTIGSEIIKMQNAFYDETELQFYKDDNEEHLYWAVFDQYNKEGIQYSSNFKIIGLNHSDINTFTTELSNKLSELFLKINVDELYIISHLKLDFFGNRDNKFKPLVNAYKNLESIVGEASYDEAFKLGVSDLRDLIDIIFWTTRCDPSVAEYIFLFDKNEKISLYLCKYGNIHLTEFGGEVLSDNTLTSLGWTIIDGPCFDNFTEDGKIKGRKLKL